MPRHSHGKDDYVGVGGFHSRQFQLPSHDALVIVALHDEAGRRRLDDSSRGRHCVVIVSVIVGGSDDVGLGGVAQSCPVDMKTSPSTRSSTVRHWPPSPLASTSETESLMIDEDQLARRPAERERAPDKSMIGGEF